MATISVSCDFCGRTFTVPSSKAGEMATCECGSTIPVQQSQAESPPDDETKQPSSDDGGGEKNEQVPQRGWYVYEDGESVGPKKMTELRRLIQSGEVDASQKVYHESLNEWRTVSSLSYLSVGSVPKPEEPPANSGAGERKWYVRVGGSKYGPYSDDRVRKMLDKNQLRPDSQIWNSELGQWREVQNVEPFASSLPGETPSKSKDKTNVNASSSAPPEPPSPGKNVKKEDTKKEEEKKEETTRNDTTSRPKKRKKETTKTGLTTNLKGLFQRGGKDKGGGAQVPSTVLTVEYVDDTEGIETYLKDIVRTLEGLQEQADQVQQYVSRLARAVNQQKKQQQQSIKALRRRLDRLYTQIEEQSKQAPVAKQEQVSSMDTEEEVEVEEEEFGVPDEYSNDDAHQRAWQVAEVMASDLEAYHPDELEEAVMYGNLEEVLGEPIAEARETYQDRTPERVREEVDYFDMALRELVARKKTEMNQEEVS